jgi:hypothetical protein
MTPLLDRITIDSAREKHPPPVREIIERRRAERNAAKPKRTRSVMAPPPVEPVTDPHPTVRATATALQRATPSQRGVVEATGPGLGGISIGVDSVERIIAFLDSLARACEARGMHLVAEERRLVVVAGDDDATFEITEKTKQVPHVLTKAESAAEEKRRKRNERIARGHWDTAYDFDPLPPKFDTVRTGQLGLRVFGYGDGLRWSWNDGKMQPLRRCWMTSSLASRHISPISACGAKNRNAPTRRAANWSGDAASPKHVANARPFGSSC